MRELLIENKDSCKALVENKKTHEKSLMAVQEKVLHDLEPLSCLWLIVENEKLSLTEWRDEEVQKMTAISRLFEKTMLLIE